MKKTYIKPETGIDTLTLEAPFLGISGQDENGNTIIGGGENGDNVDPDVNRHSLWDEVEEDY
ncbi:MAG: hypothetical protein J5529_09480 [Prevotella sp.]|nr:hypothetical protein [Prevotella sp.]